MVWTERKCVDGRKGKSVCRREGEHVRKEIKSGRRKSKTEIEIKSGGEGYKCVE